MGGEAYSYTVLASFLGMGIVFSFLGFLCIFMYVLKKVIDKPKSEKNSSGGESVKVSSAAASKSSSDDNAWIIAAVAAYLEEESAPVSAMAWIPSASEKQEPWVTVPRIQKRLARA